MKTMNDTLLVVTPDMLDELPVPVQRYLNWTGVVGRPWISAAYVKQVGQFRLGFDKPWMPLSAEQIFSTNPPGMVWNARFKMAGLPLMRARDSYRDGEGHMFGKAAGLVTIFDDKGEELTLGTLTRYLSELIWLPIAFLGDNITWVAVDDSTADVSLTDHGRTVSGRMVFDDEGRPLRFEAMRFRGDGSHYVLTPWQATNDEFGRRDGLNIPVRSAITWQLPEGELTYGHFQIETVAYNRPGDHL